MEHATKVDTLIFKHIILNYINLLKMQLKFATSVDTFYQKIDQHNE